MFKKFIDILKSNWEKNRNSKGQLKKAKTIDIAGSKSFIDTKDIKRTESRVVAVTSRVLSMSIFLNIALCLVIVTMMPLKRNVPYFVTFLPKEEQIVFIEPYKSSKTQERKIKEFMARDYVTKRETIDQATEFERWQTVQYWSTPEVKKDFLDYYSEQNSSSPYKYAVDNKLVRTIKITGSNVLSNYQFQVEFEITDTSKVNGQLKDKKIGVATVTFTAAKEEYKGNVDALRNPFGWLVSDYSIGWKEVLTKGGRK